jgi:hypothetical protein
MKTVARPIIVVVIMLTLIVFLPTLALAADAQTQGCPDPVGEGVVCTGPAVPPNFLPVVQADRQCPQEVGEGVICTGPEVPVGATPVEGQIISSPMSIGLFLPMINR